MIHIGITNHLVGNCWGSRPCPLDRISWGPAPVHYSSSGASSFSRETSVAPILLLSPRLQAQFLQSSTHPPLFRFLHRLHAHLPLTSRSHANRTATSVPAIVTTTLKKVVVETPHPSPLALSSQRSLLWGQMFCLKIGDNIGKVDGFGRQAEDCGSDD